MKTIEITEASKAEKDRQRKAQAIRDRERAQFELQQQELRSKQALELRRQAKLKQLQAKIGPKQEPEQPTGIFSSPEFSAFRTDDDVEKGLYLKFEPVGQNLFVYWTTKYNRNLEIISKTTGLFKPLGKFTGTNNENAFLIRLINDLLPDEEYIHILLDKKVFHLFPGLQNFAKYINYLKKNTPFGKRKDVNNNTEETVTLEVF